MEAWVSPVSNWLFGHQKTKPVTAVSDQPVVEHQSRPLSEEEEEPSDRTQDRQQEYVVRAQNDQQSNEPTVHEQPQNRQCYPTTLSKINLEEIVPQQDIIENRSLLINSTSIADTTTEPINPVEPSHQKETTEESLQQTLAQASQASPTQEEGTPKLIEKLRAVTRAIGWLLSNSDTNTDAKGRGQDTGSSTKGTGNRRNRKGHKKPLPPPPPPRPVISKKRLKVFVGTWNMMGQMPRARDGLTGFIDVHDPTHPVPAAKNPADQGQQAHNTSHSHLRHHHHIPDPAEESPLNSNSDIHSSMEGPGFSQHNSRTPRDRNQVGNDHNQQRSHGLKSGVLEDPFLEMNAGAPYHIIVINTQECEREIREAVLFPSKVAWEKQLQASIGPEYVMIKTETMAALHIAVFVWKPIESLVNAVDSSTVATGIAGIVGNKGAVAVSVYLGSTSFLFVNAHLTAHQANTHARNSDYKRIINELQLNDTPKNSPGLWYFKGDMKLRRHYNSPPPLVPQKSFKVGAKGKANGEKPIGKSNSNGNLARSPSRAKLVPESKAPDHSHSSSDGHSNGQAQVGTAVDITEQFDYTFWAGDLNYRVDLTRAQADEYLQKGDLETLFAHDQLTAERKAGRVFEGFMEAPIRFKPTYKFDPITSISDNRLLKNRQKTLLRHKSLVNLSDNLHIHHGSISRLEHNLSTPTLNVGASKDDLGSPLSLSAEANVLTKRENVNSGELTNGNFGNNAARKDGSKVPSSNHTNENEGHIKEPTRKPSVSTKPSSVPHPPNSESHLNHQSDNAPAQASHEKDSIGDSIQREDSLVVMPRKEAPLSGPPQPDSKRSDSTKVDLPENGERQLEKLRQVQLGRYDTSSKQRVPSWTDRILWKSTGGNHYLPLEIGDDTRSGGGDHGRGWSLLRKNRTKIASSSSQSQISHSEEIPGCSPEQYQRVQDMGAESASESTTVLGSESGSMSILKLGRKKNKEGSRDGKMSLLESLKFHRAGHKSRRDSTPPSPQSSGMSEEDEDRAAVIVKQYTAHHDIGQFSDHRPVTAVFAVRFDWNLTDRGAIGDGAGNGASRWSPLDKVLEKLPS